MRIGELAAATGISVRALRYYEEQGLLAPRRTPTGQRVFDPADVAQVGAIRDLLSAGFCSSVIADLLPAVGCPDSARDQLAAAFAAARHRLESERHAIDDEMTSLAELASSLGLDPHVHVREDAGPHDRSTETTPAPADHRDRRLRRGAPLLP